jgi:uncharacterized membrane protein YhfC
MIVSAIVACGLPVGLFIVWRKKYGLKIVPVMMGVASFVIAVLVLESSIHQLVFSQFNLRENPLVYIIYGVLMAGVFEETARFVCFKILKKKYQGVKTGLAYGLGHGGIEAIIVGGLAMVNAVIFSVILNLGMAETITADLPGEVLAQVETQIEMLTTSPPYLFLLGGLERIFALGIQISLSIIVYYSVYGKKKWWLYPLAIGLHALIDIPAAAMQVSVIKNVFIVELLVGLSAIILVLIAKKIRAREKLLGDGE